MAIPSYFQVEGTGTFWLYKKGKKPLKAKSFERAKLEEQSTQKCQAIEKRPSQEMKEHVKRKRGSQQNDHERMKAESQSSENSDVVDDSSTVIPRIVIAEIHVDGNAANRSDDDEVKERDIEETHKFEEYAEKVDHSVEPQTEQEIVIDDDNDTEAEEMDEKGNEAYD